MTFELTLLIVYRLLALGVAAAMVWVVLRNQDWRSQVFAALVMIPFALRAAGLK